MAKYFEVKCPLCGLKRRLISYVQRRRTVKCLGCDYRYTVAGNEVGNGV